MRDPSGDAPSRYDLRGVDFTNDADAFTVAAQVADLRRSGTQAFALFLRPAQGESTYTALSFRRPDGRVVTRLSRYGGEESGPVRCAVTGRWQPGADMITVRVPRECLPDLEEVAVRAYVAIGQGDGSAGDPADSTREARVPR